MNMITVRIDGMMCSMCESHICNTIRRVFPDAQKVTASKRNGKLTFLIDKIDETKLRNAITDIGYTFVEMDIKPYVKRSILKLFK